MPETPYRRAADVRLEGLTQEVAEVRSDMREVRIDVREVRDVVLRQQGAWRAFLGVATILGAIGAFFGIAAYLGFGPQ